jgi:hypothetical protein
MNDPVMIELVRYLVAGVVCTCGIGATTFLGLMCFPSIRSAFVERLRQRSLRRADTAEVTDQLAALRGEVYALRAELAQAPRAALSAGSEETGRK